MVVEQVAKRAPAAGPQSSTRRFLTGLIGEDIQASRSPWVHEREADEQGVRLIYSLFDLAHSGEGSAELGPTLDAVKRAGFSGVNVTHPYKQAIIPFLDELSDEAKRIGAVNTVAFSHGRSRGYNTDYLGFAEGLRRGLGDSRFRNVVQLGAGGAGAATAYALLEHGTGVLHLHDVRRDQAENLAGNLSQVFGANRIRLIDEEIQSAIQGSDGLVNATPVGMVGHEGLPMPAEWLRPSLWVADIIYFPLETALLKEARAKGCRTLNGVTMVVFQAAAAFDLFTGLQADRERMLAAALRQWSD